MRTIIGIDPGAKGGIAYIRPDGSAGHGPMPDTPAGILRFLTAAANGGAVAYVENVHPMPGEGVSSVWTFAKNVAHVEMACAGLGIPVNKVAPQTWQKCIGTSKRASVGDKPVQVCMEADEVFKARKKAWLQRWNAAKRDKKNDLKCIAQERFPSLRVTLSTCDALLIADYGRRLETKG
jgi:crossover junction endodeoxyribonuclease RuvC